LPPVCRNVFIFRQIEGYSKKEIAEKMGISINTVDNHLTHGMKLCRRYLKETVGFSEGSLEALLKQA
ncbi:MAG: RNA polymerase sigma factor, partial [Halieaceae bacterium]|nr:RNA polymerase sigma factor [Halieaceae bacterium]